MEDLFNFHYMSLPYLLYKIVHFYAVESALAAPQKPFLDTLLPCVITYTPSFQRDAVCV